MLGQVLFKFENIRVPGKPRTKDANVLAANFWLHCSALQTLTLLEPHMPRCPVLLTKLITLIYLAYSKLVSKDLARNSGLSDAAARPVCGSKSLSS